MTEPSWWWGAVAAVARRPGLWATAAGQVFRLAQPGWWRRSPFLPVPSDEYLRFRMETQYGNGRPTDPDDVVTYLHWCRSLARSA